jgi:hypothetical protein
MRNSGYKNRLMDLSRLFAKLGLVLTDPKLRAAINDEVQDRVDHVKNRVGDVADTFASRYDDAADRLDAARSALQGRDYWPSRAVGFLLGVGVGAGLGLLLAPTKGTETREAMRDKAVAIKNKIVDSASNASAQVRRSMGSMPSTGTEG